MTFFNRMRAKYKDISEFKKFFLLNMLFFMIFFLTFFMVHNPPDLKSACVGLTYCLDCCARCIGGYGACNQRCASNGNWTGFYQYGNPCNQYDDQAHACKLRIYFN